MSPWPTPSIRRSLDPARPARASRPSLVPGELIYAGAVGSSARIKPSRRAPTATSAGAGRAARQQAARCCCRPSRSAPWPAQRARRFTAHYARIALRPVTRHAALACLVLRVARRCHTEDEIVLGSHHDQTTDSDGDTHDHYVAVISAPTRSTPPRATSGSLHDGKTRFRSASAATTTGRPAHPRPSGGYTASILTATAIVFLDLVPGARRRASRARGFAARSTNRARGNCPTCDRARLVAVPRRSRSLEPQIGDADRPLRACGLASDSLVYGLYTKMHDHTFARHGATSSPRR